MMLSDKNKYSLSKFELILLNLNIFEINRGDFTNYLVTHSDTIRQKIPFQIYVFTAHYLNQVIGLNKLTNHQLFCYIQNKPLVNFVIINISWYVL